MGFMQERIKDCADIKIRDMMLGDKEKVRAIIYYVEVTVNNLTVQESVIGRLISRLDGMSPKEQYNYLEENALGVTDAFLLKTIDEAVMGIMIGDAVMFVDGYDKAIKIKSKGYPNMGVTASKTENALRGTKEGFSDSVKCNTSLIRKRVRNSDLKVKENILGEYSKTTVAVVYLNSLVREQVLEDVLERIEQIKTRGITDSGIIEQLTEDNYLSPFPQYQTTERPDKAALAVMEGRIVVLVDNSPVGLILPVNYNSFFKTADDRYGRFEIVSFVRIIRYIAAILSMSLPALYLAVISFHPNILPTKLVLTLSAAREGVPFSAMVEVLLMELAFELIREAGVRIPGPMGNTIGIVGGLIVGQAAVSANIVSPIIVIIVAATALSSFAVPNDELSQANRLIKYFMIILAAFMGIFGVIIGGFIVLAHLSGLKSFNFPYLGPVAAGELASDEDKKDLFVRWPLKRIKEKSLWQKRGKK